MLTIDLSSPALLLSGDPLPTGESYGQVIATMLSQTSSKDSRKQYNWARLLYKNEPLSVDGQDFDLLYKAVDDSNLFDFIKCPVLEMMIAAKP